MEAEKRIRREIANSNERRRMQSINAGFQSLRTLLPRHEGEKLSKAAILQQTAEYIYVLEQEKTRLLSQNSQLKRLLSQHEGTVTVGDACAKKRKGEIMISELQECASDNSGDATLEPAAVVPVVKALNLDIDDLKVQLERERRMRILLEEQLRSLESQLYPDQIALQYESPESIEPTDGLLVEERLECDSIAPTADLHLIGVELPSVGERLPSPVDMLVEEERAPTPPLPVEAAVKTEPKPDGEPTSPGEPSRLFLASTSRQNLETIVEAIRHLEGDHMFAEEQPGREQELPLALTNKPDRQRRIRVEADEFLHLRHPQSRPGVIVVKHS